MGSPLICNAAAPWLKASYFLFLSLLYISGRVVDTRNVCVCVCLCVCVRERESVHACTVLHSGCPNLIRHHKLVSRPCFIFFFFFFYRKPYFSWKNVEKLVAVLTEMSAGWEKNNLFHTQKEEEGKQSEHRPATANWELKNKEDKINK